MNILLILIALGTGLVTVFATMTHLTQSRAIALSVERRAEYVDAIQAISPRITGARDRFVRTAGACNPPNTVPRVLPGAAGGGGICWYPTAAAGCLDVGRNLSICVADTQSMTHFEGTQKEFRYASLLLPRAFAQIPAYFNAPGPQGAGVAEGGVRLRPMACGGAQLTGCLDCGAPGADCFTIIFCIGLRGETSPGCGPQNRVMQSFGRRDQL